ncbi:MAG: SMI1/KNR4 family protein [Verrucomicrobia bacterium]|nr:SMI1/KNR4 family protein [Verrucomicrobiota bacterium]
MTDDYRQKYNELRKLLLPQKPTDWRHVFAVCFPTAELVAPATQAALDVAKLTLGRHLPPDLESLLLTSDGVTVESVSLISSLSEIITTNIDYRVNRVRADCMPFDHMLFFGSAYDGDMFAYPISQKDDYIDSVFIWGHEMDCREFFAYSLLDYVMRLSAYATSP